jgi:hypothetical protein
MFGKHAGFLKCLLALVWAASLLPTGLAVPGGSFTEAGDTLVSAMMVSNEIISWHVFLIEALFIVVSRE